MTLPSLLLPEDLEPFATIPLGKASAMIAGATALAIQAAPCLAEELDEVQRQAAMSVLIAAILRWDEAGSGAKATTQESAGPFSQTHTMDTTGLRRGVFWPSEIRALQSICKQGAPYMVDMGAAGASPHRPWCARLFGASYCDCGAELGVES